MRSRSKAVQFNARIAQVFHILVQRHYPEMEIFLFNARLNEVFILRAHAFGAQYERAELSIDLELFALR